MPVIPPNKISGYRCLFTKCKQRCNHKDDVISYEDKLYDETIHFKTFIHYNEYNDIE